MMLFSPSRDGLFWPRLPNFLDEILDGPSIGPRFLVLTGPISTGFTRQSRTSTAYVSTPPAELLRQRLDALASDMRCPARAKARSETARRAVCADGTRTD